MLVAIGFSLILYNPFGMDIFKEGEYKFAEKLDFCFHYEWVDEESLAVQYWDPSLDTWQTEPELIADTLKDRICFESSTLHQFYTIWVKGGHSGVAYSRASVPIKLQNYPNPFNSKTTRKLLLSK